MKIVVCIKQVPDTNDVKWNKDNNLVREGLTSILNPYDECAVRCAVNLKEKCENLSITLLSMGPKDAKKALEYGLALGADEAILLSDKKFSGADTKATGKTLAAAIQNAIKDFDYIFTGQFAIDGDTAQTGPSLACALNLPSVGYVREVLDIDSEKIKIETECDEEILIQNVKGPCVISLLKSCAKLQNPKIEDYIRAQKKEIKVLTLEDIKMDENEAGIKGSPTFVQKAFRPENNRWCKKVKYDYVREILSCLKN